MESTPEIGKLMILAIAIVTILGCFSVLLFIIFLKRKNQTIKSKEEAERIYKQELIKTQVEIQTQTMKHIGREIHDNVGQKLTLSSLYLQQLVFENQVPQVSEKINTVNDIINESLEELRSLSKSLTDDTIQNSSIIALIENECEKIRDLKKCAVSFENKLKTNVTSYQTKSILLRIVQEFIQNSVKHSQCKTIDISLSNLQNELQLMLKDDGQGFDVNIKSEGIGLKNIKKRVEILKGTSTLQSNKNGTKLTIKIPL
ncbi:MAG: sensor histidine kinase [Polaribacter sp.]